MHVPRTFYAGVDTTGSLRFSSADVGIAHWCISRIQLDGRSIEHCDWFIALAATAGSKFTLRDCGVRGLNSIAPAH